MQSLSQLYTYFIIFQHTVFSAQEKCLLSIFNANNGEHSKNFHLCTICHQFEFCQPVTQVLRYVGYQRRFSSLPMHFVDYDFTLSSQHNFDIWLQDKLFGMTDFILIYLNTYSVEIKLFLTAVISELIFFFIAVCQVLVPVSSLPGLFAIPFYSKLLI